MPATGSPSLHHGAPAFFLVFVCLGCKRGGKINNSSHNLESRVDAAPGQHPATLGATTPTVRLEIKGELAVHGRVSAQGLSRRIPMPQTKRHRTPTLYTSSTT
ncbi:unnamed protein product [Pleuronectes platessa]|uniref:Secreted protein n=1 Tax=Pleuronectes platessa TaxID=8262 RepID=A0A9N7UGE9_PLEPL|nr:unnamed protein product [Pleuronectes platessa]